MPVSQNLQLSVEAELGSLFLKESLLKAMGKVFEDVKTWYQAVDSEGCQDYTCEHLKPNKITWNMQAEF